MCGIAGIFRFRSARPVERSELSAMSTILAHRGPDGSGIYEDNEFGFCHRRLSIIDTSSRAAQPMSTSDGRLHIVFNGEIYNYVELRSELERCGVTFRTSSDTEVLLEAFHRFGPECLQKLNGMFAFAIWNSAERSLFLARDHVGIKPLYVATHSQGLTFASEIKAILLDDTVKRIPNARSLDAYLRFGYVPGEETMFDGVNRLLPGHFMQVKDGGVSVSRYWDVTYSEPSGRKESDYIEEADSLMRDAVSLQLRSDVPLGVFLSGGLDSSAIVALTHSLGVRNLNTYSIGWKHGKGFDESSYARQVSRQFGTNHHEHWMSAREFRDSLDRFTWLMDEPVTEAAAISLQHIASVARRDVTVVLSGEGADEVFGGYPIYWFMQMVEEYKRFPAGLRRHTLDPLLSTLNPRLAKYVALSHQPLEDSYMGVSFYDREMAYSLASTDARAVMARHPVTDVTGSYYKATADEDIQRRMQYLDLKTWLVDDLLIKADRMTMGASVELRVPFLDYRLLEFSARLPPKLRIKHRRPKYLMKRAAERYLPHNIIHRTKRGFPTPLAALFRGEMRDYLTDTLRSSAFRQRGLFNEKAVGELLHRHQSGDGDHHRNLWQVLVLENWYRTFIDPGQLPRHDSSAHVND